MTDNRLVQQLRGALCQLVNAVRSPTPGDMDKALKRADMLLSMTRKRKAAKRKARAAQ